MKMNSLTDAEIITHMNLSNDLTDRELLLLDRLTSSTDALADLESDYKSLETMYFALEEKLEGIELGIDKDEKDGNP